MTKARILLMGLALFIFVPVASFSDSGGEPTVWDTGYVPGAPNSCYGNICLICNYIVSASKGPQPPECARIDYPANCSCTILVDVDPAMTSCNGWGTCYYHM